MDQAAQFGLVSRQIIDRQSLDERPDGEHGSADPTIGRRRPATGEDVGAPDPLKGPQDGTDRLGHGRDQAQLPGCGDEKGLEFAGHQVGYPWPIDGRQQILIDLGQHDDEPLAPPHQRQQARQVARRAPGRRLPIPEIGRMVAALGRQEGVQPGKHRGL